MMHLVELVEPKSITSTASPSTGNLMRACFRLIVGWSMMMSRSGFEPISSSRSRGMFQADLPMSDSWEPTTQGSWFHHTSWPKVLVDAGSASTSSKYTAVAWQEVDQVATRHQHDGGVIHNLSCLHVKSNNKTARCRIFLVW